MIICPVCNQRAVGKVGADQYYCWECCVEFSMRGTDVKIFSVELDGSLTVFGETVPEIANLQMQEG